MSEKKDLTRIEDLGEFLHEIDAEDEQTLDDFPSEVPDLPSESEETPFDEGALEFGTTEDFGSSFTSSTESETPPEESIPEEAPSIDFSSNDFETSLGEEEKKPEELSPEIQEGQTASWNTDIPMSDLFSDPEPIPEPKIESTYVPEKEFKTPETFEDLKKFSESSSFSGMATEGNPSFSVLIKNVRYIEDINDIIILLRELGLLTDTEDMVKARLMRGMLLVPRISEYAAIFLSHKLRRFNIDIQIGLSDEIHSPKHQETPETGIVSKFNLFQNQSHHFHFDDPKLELSQIIVAATNSLEGYQVLRYMGVASEHKMLDSQIVEDESSDEIPRHYQELAMKLKAHALKANSNAVVGLNYQLTPIPSEFGLGGHKYRLTCTGNLVWVNKL